MQLAERTSLGPYRLLRELGRGGMGIVYAARDTVRGRDVALKTLRFNEPAALYRFKNEFRSLADVDHPNLVTLHELVNIEDQWFFTMELVDGVDFVTYVRHGCKPQRASRRGDEGNETVAPLSRPEQIQRLRDGFAQLALGLAALHDVGLIHRDIKPSNILVTAEGRVVVLDFGLVTPEYDQGGGSSEMEVVGTAIYMAPEQAASQETGAACDWYSAGVILYEILTGRRPFSGVPLEILTAKQRDEPVPPRDVAPGLPEDLDVLCRALLRRDPDRRITGEKLLSRLGVRPGEVGSNKAAADTFTQTPPFVGRGAELERMQAACERAARGEQATLFVRGESGVGKTALARRFVARLREEVPAAVVLRGRCYERELVPYKGVDGLIDSLSQYLLGLDHVEAALLLPWDAVLLARLFPVLARVPVLARMPRARAESVNPMQLRARAFAALRALLDRMRSRTPVALVIDDLQWTDPDSLALLSELLQPPRAPAVLLLATVRTSRDAPLPAALQRFCGPLGEVDDFEITALPPDHAFELAHQLLRRATGAATAHMADQVARESQGHPLFIDELVRHVGRTAMHAGELRLDEALWARIEGSDDEARRLLEVIAVAGVPLALKTAARAAGMSLADAGKWVSLLRVAHLARASGGRADDRVEPFHDRVREAVMQRLDDSARIDCHRRLAEALQSAGAATAAPELLVQHLEAAGFRSRAAKLAATTADRTADALAFERAVELYRDALRLGDDSGEFAQRLRLRLADALCDAGRGVEAVEVLRQLAAEGDKSLRLDCERRSAEQLLLNGHIERGLQALAAVLAEIGERYPATPQRAYASLLWGRLRLRLRGLSYRERDESEIAPRDLVKLDVFTGVVTGTGNVDNIRGAAFHARALLLALKLGEPRRLCRALGWEAMLCSAEGCRNRERAEQALSLADALANKSGDPELKAWIVAARGTCRYFAGRESEAVDLLQRAEWLIRDRVVGATFALNSVRLFRLLALRALGRCAELRRDYHELLRDAGRRGDLFMETTIVRAFNLVWLMDDDPDRALRALDRSGWVPATEAFHYQHWYELRARCELEFYSGVGIGARERVWEAFDVAQRSHLTRVQAIRTELTWLRARYVLQESDFAATELRRLIRDLERESVPVAQVYAWYLRAAAAARQNDIAGAIASLRFGVEHADARSLGLHAASGQLRLGQLMGGDQGRELVAAAEAWFREQEIRNPDALSRVLVPSMPAAD